MTGDRGQVSPDQLRLTVDGQVFDITHDLTQPGAYHYSWVSGRNCGYGFTSRGSDHARRAVTEHEASIRRFLAAVDPVTGYIEDDDEDEESGEGTTIDRDARVLRFPDRSATD